MFTPTLAMILAVVTTTVAPTSTPVVAPSVAPTSAAVFTPPMGWVQLPQSATSMQVGNIWQGPERARGERETFSVTILPYPGSVDMLASAMSTGLAKVRLGKVLSNHPVSNCGVSGRLLTLRLTAGGRTSIIEQELFGKNGYAYLLAYTRSQNAARSAAIGQVLSSFCPSGQAQLQTLPIPADWTARVIGAIQTQGMWMGKRPGEMMVLLHGPHMNSLPALLSNTMSMSFSGPGMSSGSNGTLISIASKKQTTICGQPGMDVTIQVKAPGMPITVHELLTQSATTSYVLTYVHSATVPADPGAVAALGTLCPQ